MIEETSVSDGTTTVSKCDKAIVAGRHTGFRVAFPKVNSYTFPNRISVLKYQCARERVAAYKF